MIIFVFTMVFLAVFLLTKSYQYIERFYPTLLYMCFISVLYTLICTNYLLWAFPTWWIFTNHANFLLQASVLFPVTTVMFLRYLPNSTWLKMLYFVFFVALYGAMEWVMRYRHEIVYHHGWTLLWSVVIDGLMFSMLWLHQRYRLLTWGITFVTIAFLVIWFDVPLFA